MEVEFSNRTTVRFTSFYGGAEGVGVLGGNRVVPLTGTFKMDCPMGLALSKTTELPTWDVVEGMKKGRGNLILGMKRALPENSKRAWPFVDPMTGDGRVTDSYQDENGDWRDR